ncbi:MAG: tetratricopeptide repeat protein [Acidobacteriota bacterium]
MNTLLVLTRDSDLLKVLRAALPRAWDLQERGTVAQAMEFLADCKPTAIVADMTLAGQWDGLAFVRTARGHFPDLPPVAIVAAAGVGEELESRVRDAGVAVLLPRPLDESSCRQALARLVAAVGPARMSLIEVLGEGFVDFTHRRVAVQTQDGELHLLFGEGRLWTLVHPLYWERYRSGLLGAGLECGEQGEDLQLYLAELEERLARSVPMAPIKQQATLSLLASLPLHTPMHCRSEPVVIPEGLLPIEIPALLVQLVDQIPEEALAVLRRPGVKVSRVEEVLPEDLPIQPHHGYLLQQCQQAVAVSDLLQTGILPGRQLLGGVYLLLLLGLLASEPAVEPPFRLSGLAVRIDEETALIQRQSEAIQNLVRALKVPGISPYKVLGVPPGAAPADAVKAHEALKERLSPANLHPEVFKRHQKELFFLAAKMGESLLLLQNRYLEDRKAEARAESAEAEGGPNPVAQAGTALGRISENRQREAQLSLRRAIDCMAQEQWHDASQHLRLALFHNGFSPQAHYLMAKIYEKNTNSRAKHMAEREFQRAIELDPRDIEYLLDLAEFYLNNGLFARCRAYLDKAQAISLRDPRAIAMRKRIKEIDR